jgi:hypothetical protein
MKATLYLVHMHLFLSASKGSTGTGEGVKTGMAQQQTAGFHIEMKSQLEATHLSLLQSEIQIRPSGHASIPSQMLSGRHLTVVHGFKVVIRVQTVKMRWMYEARTILSSGSLASRQCSYL